MSKTFQPDSLHPYIMDARLKKATGSGGISNIPIASADTVGGIMIGGSANPITITGSGNASVRKATSELLGVVKAGDGVTVDADGAISGVAYSTTGHKTGRKWIDGKDIYEKVIVFASPILVTTSWTDTPESITGYDTLVKCHANTADGNAYTVDCIKGTTYLQLKRYTDGNVNSITLEYTEPTTP